MLAEMLQRGIKWSQCWLGDREGIRVLNTLAAAPPSLRTSLEYVKKDSQWRTVDPHSSVNCLGEMALAATWNSLNEISA